MYILFIPIKMSSRGQIHTIAGPMFAGKTARLRSHINTFRMANMYGPNSLRPNRCLIIKCSKDTRGKGKMIRMHDKQEFEATVAVHRLSDVDLHLCEEAEMIGIDEGQFFDDLIEFCQLWAGKGKKIFVCGLLSRADDLPFGQMPELVRISEHVEIISSYCMRCGNPDAIFNVMIEESDAVIKIGDEKDYMVLCRNCKFGDKNTEMRTTEKVVPKSLKIAPKNENLKLLPPEEVTSIKNKAFLFMFLFVTASILLKQVLGW